MAARPTWQGHLKLSLVTCPVSLYKAVEPSQRGISFKMISPESHAPIAMKTHDAVSGEEVSRSELVKGYEIDKGLFVTVTADELAALKLESNGAFQIERFVPEAEIDRLYWETPHYLVPDGALAYEPYAVIREAMRAAGQVALARVVMNGRERPFALEVRGKGIVAHALRTHAEVRGEEQYFAHLPETPPDAGMVAIARQILEQHAGPFDPLAFRDRYREAVLELVEQKKRAKQVSRAGGPPETDEGQVIDLMEALRRSLAGTAPGNGNAAVGGDRRKRTTSAAKPAAARTKARKRA